jgi:hypothetical protein
MINLMLSGLLLLCSAMYISGSDDLGEASKAKLIAQVKAENVKKNYWPSDVVVRLEKFYKMPGNNGSDASYFVKAVGSYMGHILIEYDNGTNVMRPQRLGKATEGSFSKKELESLGIQLPE